jgi:hypothetical protein
MSQHDESPSFSLDLCLDAVSALGGEHTASILGQAVQAVADEATAPISLIDAIAALGGEHTKSILGQALIAVANEEVETPTNLTDAIQDLGGVYTKSVLGQALIAFANEEKKATNLTAQWLATHGRDIRQMLVNHVAYKLQTSQKISVVEDHVQTFLLRIVERDTLAPYLRAGKTPQASVLRIWAYQSACTEMRGWGVDASLRTSRGAKTNRDLMADAGKLPMTAIHSGESAIERRYEVENGKVVSDLWDPNTRSAEDNMISGETLERARELVLRKIAGAGPRYAALFEALTDGGKRSGLASKAGVSRNRMVTMLARIREVLRDEDVLQA